MTCVNPDRIAPSGRLSVTLAVGLGTLAALGVNNFATLSNDNDRNVSNNLIGDPTVVLPGR